MVNLVEEAVSHDLDVYDLSRFCGMAPSSRVDFVELTEAQLQAVEEKANNWLMGVQGIL